MAHYINTTNNEIISDVVVATESNDIGEYIGVSIITNMQTINVFISSQYLCCEDYGVQLKLGELKTVINEFNENDVSQFKNVLVGQSISFVKFLPDIKNDSGYPCKIPILIGLSGEFNLEVFIMNDHNGYYAHDYFVKWGTYKDTGSL